MRRTSLSAFKNTSFNIAYITTWFTKFKAPRSPSLMCSVERVSRAVNEGLLCGGPALPLYLSSCRL